MLREMFKRQKTGSVVCPSCGSLVGVNDDQCYTCGRRNPGLWGYAGVLRHLGNDLSFVPVVIYGCAGLYLLTIVVTMLLGGNVMGRGDLFSLLAPADIVAIMFGMSGADPVFGLGRWWTVLSAGWLHGSILHIVFNMMWVRDLGPVVAEIYGGARLAIIYMVSSAAGFVLSSVLGHLPFVVPIIGGANRTLGASAGICGLLGALLHYGNRGGSRMIRSHAISCAVMILISGFLLARVDNSAHLGGFVGGYLTSVILDPLKRERVNHMVIALLLTLATVLAILASIVSTLRLI